MSTRNPRLQRHPRPRPRAKECCLVHLECSDLQTVNRQESAPRQLIPELSLSLALTPSFLPDELQNVHFVAGGCLVGGRATLSVLYPQTGIVALVKPHKLLEIASFGRLWWESVN